MKIFTPVYIEWVDAGGLYNDGWQSIIDDENEPEVTLVKTLGFFMKETKYYIYVAQNYDHPAKGNQDREQPFVSY